MRLSEFSALPDSLRLRSRNQKNQIIKKLQLSSTHLHINSPYVRSLDSSNLFLSEFPPRPDPTSLESQNHKKTATKTFLNTTHSTTPQSLVTQHSSHHSLLSGFSPRPDALRCRHGKKGVESDARYRIARVIGVRMAPNRPVTLERERTGGSHGRGAE